VGVKRRFAGWGRKARRGLTGAAAVVFACLSYTWFTLPDVRPLNRSVPESTAFMRLRAAEAEDEGRSYRPVRRWIPYSRVSPALRRAVLVAEDAAFWEHEGIDLNELRASIETRWTRGGVLRGGSTITQQLAKNLYLTAARNPYRKIVELQIARRLEAELSKARIFELYLNLIEWGEGIWGAEAAARTYFGRSASDLTADQAALLAGAIINPRIYSPRLPNPRLLRRQQIILRRMGLVTPPVD
jgi:monofunctional biosynthetic peptidoglycan transglycosylase